MMKRLFLLLTAVLLLFWCCERQEILPVPREEDPEQQKEPEKPKEEEPEQPRDEGDHSGTDLLSFFVEVDGKEYHPVDASGTELSIFVPMGTALTALKPKFTHNALKVTVGGKEQKSGETVVSFAGYKKGTVYKLTSDSGQSKSYTVRVLDTRLPVVSVTTVKPGAIKDKTTWREASLRIFLADGTVQDLGDTFIRGRGNWTWDYYPKKPYSLKLADRHKVLDMPAHKRWVLLAQYRGFIGNPMMFEATRRAPSMKWAPRGYYVELVLNGKFQGLYYLCEHIKIDKNRVDIDEIKPKDVKYPDVTGGYLLEYDELYDEEFKFKSAYFDLPVQIKHPNDTMPDAQFRYIRGFINEMEAELKKIGTSQTSKYANYLDRKSFADYWLVLETMGNYEAYKPRSVKMYKGRDGVGVVSKLMAGPLWDQELFEVKHRFNNKDAHYFKYLFKDPAFVACVKERWAVYKGNILGNESYEPFLDYLNEMVDLIKESAKRDLAYCGNEYFSLSEEVATVRQGFRSKIDWMDAQIQSF